MVGLKASFFRCHGQRARRHFGGPKVGDWLLDLDFPMVVLISLPHRKLRCMIAVYIVAAVFNLRIPHTGVAMQPIPTATHLLPDFWRCNTRLWQDKLGQISLATTTLFWGAAGNLKVIVIAWAAAAMSYSVTEATTLVGVVGIGTAERECTHRCARRLTERPT